MVEDVTRWCVRTDKPVWAKMTPNITDIRVQARAAAAGGAHGVAAISTILAVIGVDLDSLRPVPTVEGHSTPGGYSYYAVKPIALRMVSEMAIDQPELAISGIGGSAMLRTRSSSSCSGRARSRSAPVRCSRDTAWSRS